MPGKLANAGNTLDFAIGQLDNYTTIELAQYVSTIANGGKKIQPRLVRRAFDPGTQNVVYENYVLSLIHISSIGKSASVKCRCASPVTVKRRSPCASS